MPIPSLLPLNPTKFFRLILDISSKSFASSSTTIIAPPPTTWHRSPRPMTSWMENRGSIIAHGLSLLPILHPLRIVNQSQNAWSITVVSPFLIHAEVWRPILAALCPVIVSGCNIRCNRYRNTVSIGGRGGGEAEVSRVVVGHHVR